ncbi:MAG: hypothetical protein PGN15_01685 [Aeromicrobium erythreum]
MTTTRVADGELVEVAGDHEDRRPGRGEVADDVVDLSTGADVDTDGGLVEDQQPGPGQHALADHDPSAGCRR